MDFGTDRILVTGALGWLGRGLIHALSHGLPEVERLRNAATGLAIRALILPGQDAAELLKISPRIEVVVGDVTKREDCDAFCAGAQGAILFHTAGIIHPRRVREFYDVNVEGTKHLLDAAIATGVRRAVVVSSNSPCGCNPHPDHLFDEESSYRPYMHYGRSKMLMELAVEERQEAGAIETVLIRAPWFYGPFQPPRQTLFFEMIRDGKAPIVGDGNNLRSMAYIDNLAQGLILAAMTPRANGQVYWIADERPYSMNEIIDTVEQLLESEFQIPCAHKRIRLPHLVSELARVTDGCLQAAGVYHQKLHVLGEMNKTIACSVALAQSDLGYTPHIALKEGMGRSLRWALDLLKAA